MKRCIYEPDLFRLFHTKKIIVSVLGVILVVIAGNILEMKEQADFLTVDTIMDSFLDGGWYRNFIFVLGAVPFAVSYFEDKSHGFHRQMILRMGLEKYTSSKVKYTALSAFFFFFCLEYGGIGTMEWSPDWGKVLGTLAMTDAGSQFNHSVIVGSKLITNFAPATCAALVFFLQTFCFFFLGELYIVCNLLSSKRNYGRAGKRSVRVIWSGLEE